jgi:hypothetical protein
MLITEKMDKLLSPSSVEFILYTKMNPHLNMLGMFKKQDLHGDKHFAFATDRNSAEDDILNGILHEPVEMEEASQLPQINISGIQEESGNTTKLGFEMEFTEEAVADNKNYSNVQRTLERAGYVMQRTLNRYAYATLVANAEAPTGYDSNPTSWASSNDDVDENIKTMQRAFNNQDGYEYNMTDMFVSKASLWGAEDYYDATRINGFDPNNVRGMTLKGINELDSGLLGIDANLSPAMWYYNVHPEDNTYNDAFGSFINVNRVEQNEEIPRGLKIQMYVEFGFAVLEPRAVLFQEGI